MSKYEKRVIGKQADEREFLQLFANKKYHPELLFHDKDIVNRLSKHPMAIWKTMNRY